MDKRSPLLPSWAWLEWFWRQWLQQRQWSVHGHSRQCRRWTNVYSLPSTYEGNPDPVTSKSTLVQPLVMETSIQPGVGSVERAHMEGHQLTSLLIVWSYKHLEQVILSCTRKHTEWGQSSDEIWNGTVCCVHYLSFFLKLEQLESVSYSSSTGWFLGSSLLWSCLLDYWSHVKGSWR